MLTPLYYRKQEKVPAGSSGFHWWWWEDPSNFTFPEGSLLDHSRDLRSERRAYDMVWEKRQDWVLKFENDKNQRGWAWGLQQGTMLQINFFDTEFPWIFAIVQQALCVACSLKGVGRVGEAVTTVAVSATEHVPLVLPTHFLLKKWF